MTLLLREQQLLSAGCGLLCQHGALTQPLCHLAPLLVAVKALQNFLKLSLQSIKAGLFRLYQAGAGSIR